MTDGRLLFRPGRLKLLDLSSSGSINVFREIASEVASGSSLGNCFASRSSLGNCFGWAPVLGAPQFGHAKYFETAVSESPTVAGGLSGPPRGTSDWQAGFPVTLQAELVSAVRDYQHLLLREFQVYNNQPRTADYRTILIFLFTVTEGNFKKRQSSHFRRSINIVLHIFVFLDLMKVLEWGIF